MTTATAIMTEIIEGDAIEIETVPARTPRVTGFNGQRKQPAHFIFGWPKYGRLHRADTIEEIRDYVKRVHEYERIHGGPS